MVKIGAMHVEDLGREKEVHLLKIWFPLIDPNGWEIGKRGIVLRIKPDNLPQYLMNSGSSMIHLEIFQRGQSLDGVKGTDEEP